MATTIRVHFEGSPYQYTAKRWNIPNHDHPFQSMPADATALIVPQTRSLFFNDQFDKRPQAITLDAAKNWGVDDDDTGLVFALAKTTTSGFCLRLVLNADKFIRHKNSKRFQAFARLVRDAQFHSAHLDEIEGLIVPIHYGMWLMDTGDWAGKVLFSITQWCGISWNELSYTRMNTEANRILVGRTFEALHDSGVDYGGLSGFDIFRHAIIDISAPGLTRDDPPECHQCMRRVPVLPLASGYTSVSFHRPRVARQVLRTLSRRGQFGGPNGATGQAISRCSIGIRWPIDGIFEGDDEYPRAIIRRIPTVDSGGEREQTPDQPLDHLPVFRSDSLSPEPDALETVADKLGHVTLEDPFAAFKA
ncbi:hypothetical protein B0H14DRAFT_3434603 [Mycena olivaceomarginata]|nr:hypothetical protein B0H14DRAFT_3434603 [Mycena olivaceomarginata]